MPALGGRRATEFMDRGALRQVLYWPARGTASGGYPQVLGITEWTISGRPRTACPAARRDVFGQPPRRGESGNLT